MGSYKYLHRFQIINCAECESTDQLTVNEYTDEVLCLVCLNEQIELEEGKAFWCQCTVSKI